MSDLMMLLTTLFLAVFALKLLSKKKTMTQVIEQESRMFVEIEPFAYGTFRAKIENGYLHVECSKRSPLSANGGKHFAKWLRRALGESKEKRRGESDWELLSRLLFAIRELQALRGAQGFVLVPREPTGAMLGLIAGEYDDGPRLTRDQALIVYRAMLAAADSHGQNEA